MNSYTIKKRLKEDQRYLNAIAVDVLKTIPNPFGSLEKAKYILKGYRNHKSIARTEVYYFTTTVHNTEDSIEIMKKYFNVKDNRERFCTVIKEVNGVQRVVYSSKPVRNGA